MGVKRKMPLIMATMKENRFSNRRVTGAETINRKSFSLWENGMKSELRGGSVLEILIPNVNQLQ